MIKRVVIGLAVAALMSSVSSACGTTVPLADRSGSAGATGGLGPAAASPSGAAGSAGLAGATSGQGSGQGGSSSGSAAVGGATGSGPEATGGSGQGAAGASATAGATQTGAAQALQGSGSGLAASGRGWDQHYVYIGVTTQKDAEQAYASAGYTGIDIGDTTAQADAIAAYVNSHGGLLGRQVKIAFDDVPTIASSENPDQYANQVCAYYSQDRPVVAVVNIVTTMDVPNFRTCLAKAGIPMFSVADTAIDSAVEQSLIPYFYTVVAPAWDTLAPLLVKRLQAQGWFGGWNPQLGQPSATTTTKIGLLVLDNPIGAQIEKILQAALAQAGYHNVISFAYEAPGNNIEPAVVNFEQNGVTHVISDDIELTTFQIYALSQHYIPRYGITTYNDPYSNLAKVAPASEQVGDMGVGWAPTYDVADAQDPGAVGPGETTCLSLMAAGGVTYTDRLAKAFALSLCDGMFLTIKGAAAAGSLAASGIYAGVNRVAPTFGPAFSFATGLRPGRAYVPGAARDLSWNTGCSCFAYRSGTDYTF